MCGICGWFGGDQPVSEEVLARMNQTLVRRGPDEGGMYRGVGAAMAMRRLSIIDLSGGQQPIHNEDGTVWVVFNGEIYNYRALRVELQRRGHRFATDSDTEVIVHLYEEYGDDLVQHLRGMFAFSLWDEKRKRALIARDRLGIKPLFYADLGSRLVFGSEIKAVLASGWVETHLDLQALDAFIAFTYIPAPLTIYRSVRKLEPGHLLVYEHGRVTKRMYWDVNFEEADRGRNAAQWSEVFDSAIKNAVQAHMVSDVPVGAFLSGGIDSSLLVALMSGMTSEPLQTFTVEFGGGQNALIPEGPLAREVAGRYGCHFRGYCVEPGFREIVSDIVDAFDEPFADDSVIPSYYVSQFTRQHVKVAVSGLGGDELFGGYERYTGVILGDAYTRMVPRFLHRGLVQPIVRKLPEPVAGGDRVNHIKRFADAVLLDPAERYLGFVSTIGPQARRQLYAPEVADGIDFESTGAIITEPYRRCAATDNLSRALYTDMKTYLPEDILALSDRLSMWHSLEVRVPLVDHELVELSARLPAQYKLSWRKKKILLRRIAGNRLPKSVMEHRKQGFESPMAAWLRRDLADYARSTLGPGALGKTGIFNMEYVDAALADHQSGRSKNNKLLFSLIMFGHWHERHCL